MKPSRTLRVTGLSILLAVLAVGPFFRGLFFWEDSLFATAAVAVGNALWFLGRRLGVLPTGIPGGAAGIGLLALFACYLIQFAWAVFPCGNLDWVLRVSAAWFAYAMVRAEAGRTLRHWLGWSFALTGFAVALHGLLGYTGYFDRNPALVEALKVVNLNDRLFTSFQYPNTGAVYLFAAILVITGLTIEEPRPWKCAAAGGLISFIGMAFFFTVSRGAVVVLPFGLLFFLVGLEGRSRWTAFLMLLLTLSAVVPALQGAGASSAVKDYKTAFLWTGLSTARGIFGSLAAMFLSRLAPRRLFAAIGALVVVSVAALLLLRPANGLLPKQAARLFDMNLRTTSVTSRLRAYQDALEVV